MLAKRAHKCQRLRGQAIDADIKGRDAVSMAKLFALFLVFSVSFQVSNVWANEVERSTSTRSQYFGGALWGTFGPYLGFSLRAYDKFAPSMLLIPALGTGQLIQGRYAKTGWIITGGELLFGALMWNTLADAFGDTGHGSETLGWMAISGFVAFRALEVIDLWAGPQLYPEFQPVHFGIYPDPKRGVVATFSYPF